VSRLSADERVPGGLGVAECAEIAGRLQDAGLIEFRLAGAGPLRLPRRLDLDRPSPARSRGGDRRAGGGDPGGSCRGPRSSPPPDWSIWPPPERLVAAGTADLVGMTRALIADPELIAKTVGGRAAEVVECVGCNQACIAITTPGSDPAARSTPATGRERTLGAHRRPSEADATATAAATGASPTPARGRRGAGDRRRPAGASAALEAASAGDARHADRA